MVHGEEHNTGVLTAAIVHDSVSKSGMAALIEDI